MIKILYGDSNDIPGAETNCQESSFIDRQYALWF